MSDSPPSLTAAEFNVLLSLADGEKHGYAILKEVEISTGALYAVIKRLLGEGLVAEVRHRPAGPDEDSRRRYYRITEEGRRAASAEAVRMEKLVARARTSRLIRAVRPV